MQTAVTARDAQPPPGEGARQPVGVGGADEGRRISAELVDGALGDAFAVGDDDDVIDGLLDL